LPEASTIAVSRQAMTAMLRSRDGATLDARGAACSGWWAPTALASLTPSICSSPGDRALPISRRIATASEQRAGAEAALKHFA
jgi:hypothetical protein